MSNIDPLLHNLSALGPHAVWVAIIVIILRSNSAKDKIIADLSTKCIDMAQAANEAYAIAAQRHDGNEAS